MEQNEKEVKSFKVTKSKRIGFFVCLIMVFYVLGIICLGQGYASTDDEPSYEAKTPTPWGSMQVPKYAYDVTGFSVEKIDFVSLSQNNFKVQTDKDVIDGINLTMEESKESFDELEFTFYTKKRVSKNLFDDMNYVEIIEGKYPSRYYVRVKYEDINLEALKELSLIKEVSSIDIGVQEMPLPDK